MHTQIRTQRTFLPVDYIGTLGGALLPEMYHTVHQYDTAHHHVIELAVPGMTSHDIKVELKNPVLWVTAQKTMKDPVSGKREVRGLPYQRTFIVPRSCEAGAITTTCRDGMLTIKLKKIKRKGIPIPVSRGTVQPVRWLQKLQEKAAPFFNLLKRNQKLTLND